MRLVPVHAKASEKYWLEFGSNLGMNGNCKRLSDVELLVSRTFQWRYPVFQTPILGNSRVIAAKIRPCLSCFGYMFSSGIIGSRCRYSKYGSTCSHDDWFLQTSDGTKTLMSFLLVPNFVCNLCSEEK